MKVAMQASGSCPGGGMAQQGGGLAEFMGCGGGGGKAGKEEERPVSVDLRPRPLKSTLFNRGGRTLVATESAVWAGLEHGIWVWDVGEGLKGSVSERSQYTEGEEDAAAFTVLPVHGSPVSCMAVDSAHKMVWSGHKDGMVRCWCSRMKASTSMLMWEAHPTGVMAMAVTSYGELWSLSQNGSLRVWPWEWVSKAVSSVGADGGMVSRSYVDLRPRILVACSGIPMVNDLRHLVVEHSNGRVWCVGWSMAVIWDARTREIVSIIDVSPGPEVAANGDNAGREQGGWFQRSRNAVLGAADAVRKAAIAVQGGGDAGKRVEAVAAGVDGSVWVGYGNGTIVQWDGAGSRRGEYRSGSAVKCICVVGTRLWVGCADGRIRVAVAASESCETVGVWSAHSSGVMAMAASGFYVFTLAMKGTIRGWNAASPHPIDSVIRTDIASRAINYTTFHDIQVVAFTWNVGEERPSVQTLQSWLAVAAVNTGLALVVVGLQEMEVGAGALALAAAKEVGLGEKGSSANGQWWIGSISAVLDHGFHLLGTRQLAGILVGVWVRNTFSRFVGDVDAAAVACGFGRALGNKGAVALKITVFRRMLCVVNSHFAAHAEALARRNADFEHVYSRISFSPSSPDSALSSAHALLWLGDFNYRLDNVSYEHACALIDQKEWDLLLRKDQLRTEMVAGRVFQGLREGQIKFPPTYKFDKGPPIRGYGYDSSEKKRVPAYCDRVLFRDSFKAANPVEGVSLAHPVKASVLQYEPNMEMVNSDHKPLRCLLNLEFAVIDEAKRRRQHGDVLRTNTQVQAWLQSCNSVPETSVSTNEILLDGNRGGLSVFHINNLSPGRLARFIVCCQSSVGATHEDASSPLFSTRCGFGFPQWIQVNPASGVIPPGQSVSITVHAVSMDDITLENVEIAQPQPARNDKTERSAVLLVSIQGDLSTSSVRYQVSVGHSNARAQAMKPPSHTSHGTQMSTPLQSYHDAFLDAPIACVAPSSPLKSMPESVPDFLTSSPPSPQPISSMPSASFKTSGDKNTPVADLLSDVFTTSTHFGGGMSTPPPFPRPPVDIGCRKTTPSLMPDLIDFSDFT